MENENLTAPDETVPDTQDEQDNSTGSAPEGSADQAPAPNEPNQAPEVPKGWVWDGNVDVLEEPFKERGKGMLRHLTQKSEELAEQRRQLEAQMQLLQKQAQPKVEPQVDPNEAYLRREYQDALESGDSQRLWDIQNRLTDYRLQKQLQSIEPEYRKIVEESQRASAEVKNTLILKEFGEKNPRFFTHKNSQLAAFVVREICDRQGKSLEDAQKVMDQIAAYYQNEAKRSLSQTVQEQKRAITATPTPSGDTKYVYVSSSKEADRMNIQFAMDGSDKIAVVKK